MGLSREGTASPLSRGLQELTLVLGGVGGGRQAFQDGMGSAQGDSGPGFY